MQTARVISASFLVAGVLLGVAAIVIAGITRPAIDLGLTWRLLAVSIFCLGASLAWLIVWKVMSRRS